MTLSRAWSLAKRTWWIVLGLGCAGGLLAFALTGLQSSVYRASATLVVVRSGDLDSLTAQDLQASQSLTRTYAALARSRAVLTAALAANPDLGLSIDDLVGTVDADAVFGTQLIEISAEANSAGAAADIANAVADALPVYVSELLSASESGGGLVVPVVGVRASEPGEPVRPNAQLNTSLGTAAGLLIGVFLAFVRIWHDDRIKDAGDLAQMDVAVLGTLPHVHRPRRTERPYWPLILDGGAGREFEQAMKGIVDSLGYALAPRSAQVVLVASAGSNEGKSLLAVNLAIALSNTGKRVALVDGNLRRSRVHTILGIGNRSGLSAALAGRRPVPVALPEAARRLRVLTSGSRLPSPVQAIRSEAIADTIRDLSKRSDYVILDSSALLSTPDTSLWLKHADCVVLVARAGHTGIGRLDVALSAVEAGGRPVAGVVLNDVSRIRDGDDR